MSRRGLLSTLLHQAQVAAREEQRRQRASVREHEAAVRNSERAQRAAANARIRADKASEAERKRFEKEAKEAHVAAMEAEATELNAGLEETYSELDSLLSATLDVDDYIDLERFRIVVSHPPFDRPDLEVPPPLPPDLPEPPKPQLIAPPTPKGIMEKLFGKAKHAEAVAAAQRAHERAISEWREKVEQIPALREARAAAHARQESDRLVSLEREKSRHAAECAEREAEAVERNKQLDGLIANLAYGSPDAVQEYISIVLSNSVYPESFPVTHSFTYDPGSAELRLHAVVPGPSTLPEVKAYKYTKASDEITATALPQKAVRDRYASIVHQVALRSIHEVFEADRRALIKTISLEVGTETIDPATGRQTYLPFVVVGAERQIFLQFDLSAVVPTLTLERMGAALSKNPYGLVPAQTTGVRRS